MIVTDHARRRMGQRAISGDDVELALLIGTDVEGGVLVRREDCDAAVRVLKQLTQDIERLAGKRFVSYGEVLVTAYRASERDCRRLMRRRGKPRRSLRG